MATILCIDDDPQMGSLMCRILEERGHVVRLVNNGKAGEEILRKQTIELLITDILMPEMDGIELLFKLRALDTCTKVLAISGGGRYIDSSAALDMVRMLGVQYTLRKPFKAEDLLDAVTYVLEGQHAPTHSI
ncbi:MAG: response regulator [Magnetococcales bacterium]|nr:response regulator [Magnetococcales bacterium]